MQFSYDQVTILSSSSDRPRQRAVFAVELNHATKQV